MCCLSFLQEYDELLGALLFVRFSFSWWMLVNLQLKLQCMTLVFLYFPRFFYENSFWVSYDLGSVLSSSWIWLGCFIEIQINHFMVVILRVWCKCIIRRNCKQMLDVQNESQKTINICKWLSIFSFLVACALIFLPETFFCHLF